METKNALLGIIAIILGIIVIAFPYFGIFTTSIIVGFGLMILSIFIMVAGFSEGGAGKAILGVIVGILGIFLSMVIIANVAAFISLAAFYLYFAGIFMIISGILTALSKDNAVRGVGVIGIILGIVYIVLGTLAFSPQLLALMIGLWLIIIGVVKMFRPDVSTLPGMPTKPAATTK
jgi:uncharacterized membrane protein HdeD (DUF308 family)